VGGTDSLLEMITKTNPYACKAHGINKGALK
jgi:hypothetical protein